MAREKFEFTGHDGSQLAGLLETPDETPRATALFAHCFTCGKDIVSASRIARALVARGFAVVRFDFTGLGSSDGDFANTNFSSNVQDLLAAAAHLEERGRAPTLLVGHSLGGTAVLAAASRLAGVRAVATIGAPADARHVAAQFGASVETIESDGEAEVLLAGRPFTIKKQFLDDIAQTSSETLRDLGAALLVMHSPIDETVSVDEAARIYTAARHPKSFVSLDGSDHLLTRPSDAAYVADIIAAWAVRYLGDERSADDAPGPDARDSKRVAGAAAAESSADGSEVGRPEVGAGEILVSELDGRFLQEVFSDAHRWFADEPERVGGGDRGPDPYEHLLAAAGACTTMTLRMYAARKGIALERASVTLRHSREHLRDCEGCEESPRRIEVIERDIELVGPLSDDDRSRLMAIADRCPVHRTLEGDLHVRTQAI